LQPIASALWKFVKREPLVHFCVLEYSSFGADALLHPPVKDWRSVFVTVIVWSSLTGGCSRASAPKMSIPSTQK